MHVYNSLSLPNMLYGAELYCKKDNLCIKQLQKTQNRILKILLNRSYIDKAQTHCTKSLKF